MLKLSSNILFTTDLLSNPVPLPEQWWYYALEGGQHISFYSKETLKYIAKKYKLNLYSFGTIHLLTKKKISNFVFNNLMKYSRKYLFKYVQKRMNSLTVQDMNKIIKSK